jgi:hypothetical protein
MMPLTEDQVTWGAASMLIAKHGDDAGKLAAERIAALALQGDFVGSALWKAIANCIEQLSQSATHH